MTTDGEGRELPEGLVCYWYWMDRRLQSEILHLVDQCGKRQYFNALRCIAGIVGIVTNNLQDVINEDEPS